MIDRILADLSKTEGIKGSMVVGKDGLVIASQIPSNLDSELIGAMASAAFGKTLMTDAGEGILVVLSDSKVNLGLIRISMKKATEKIKTAF